MAQSDRSGIPNGRGAARFCASFASLREARAETARLSAKCPGTTFDWGTGVFVRQNRAPHSRP